MAKWIHRYRRGGVLALLTGGMLPITVATCIEPPNSPGHLFVASTNDNLFEDVFDVFSGDDDDDFEDFLDDVEDFFDD